MMLAEATLRRYELAAAAALRIASSTWLETPRIIVLWQAGCPNIDRLYTNVPQDVGRLCVRKKKKKKLEEMSCATKGWFRRPAWGISSGVRGAAMAVVRKAFLKVRPPTR
jgi:hypothetical protein